MSRVRIVVSIDPDTDRRSPAELRAHVIEAWREAVQRAYDGGRIELVVAEELIRAVPTPKTRR